MQSTQSARSNGPLSAAKSLVKAAIPRRAIVYMLKPGAQKRVLLTFDDGPHETLTFQVLEALEGLGAKALFFVVGNRIGNNAHIIRAIASAGHELGNHSFSHEDFRGRSFSALRQDLERCQLLLADITGSAPTYFRPPFGRLTPALWLAATALGLRVIHWSNEGGEWGRNAGSSAAEIATKLADSIRDRQIILLHDDCDRVVDVLNDVHFRSALRSYGLDGNSLRAI